MNSLLLHMALASVSFWCQDFPGLRATPVKDAISTAVLNCRQADLDGDGALDLVFAHEAAFQSEGGFPEELRRPLPSFPNRKALDLWGDTLYFQTSNALVMVQWRDNDWKITLKQELAWPALDQSLLFEPRLEDAQPPALASFQRFLHDFNGDNIPEIVTVNEEGIHIYQHNGESYVFCGQLSVLPPLRLAPIPPQRIWPAAARRIAVPARQMLCRLFMDASRITVLERDDAPELTQSRHQQHNIIVKLDAECAPAVDGTQTFTTEFIPGQMRACRLNDDDIVDFAGGRWESSGGGPYPKAVYETWATLDGGKSFHVRRAPTLFGFRPHCSFVDFDGDGLLDMVTESLLMVDGGLREYVLGYLTRTVVESVFSVYQQIEEGFSKKPISTFRSSIHLTRPPVFNDLMFQHFKAAALIDLTGDFDGDGRRDVAVRDRPGRIAVYLSDNFSFPHTPSGIIALREEENFVIADVNGDGRSDVVLQAVQYRDGKRFESCRVCFSGEDTP